jgi:hypothetical protein
VEDNVIRVQQATRLSRTELLSDLKARANLRSLLISDARLGTARRKQDQSNVKLNVGEHQIQFRTDNSLKKVWEGVLKKNPPANVDSPRTLLAHVVKLVDRIVVDEEFRKQFKPFLTLFNLLFQEAPNVGSQGITIGGDEATEVRLINNTIENVLQGIHVGLSQRNDRTRHATRIVTISGNTIFNLLSPVAIKRDRHAIFVGNCESLLIENNQARLSRLPKAEGLKVDGIRVWGKLGGRALITQNHLASADGNREHSFNIGVNFNPLEQRQDGQLWLANFNVAPSRELNVRVTHGAQQNNNV